MEDRAQMSNNTMLAKMKRICTCLLPVSSDRQGQCIHCGACCNLPNRCLFQKSNADGGIYCAIYSLRPPNCRKYPRTASEHITTDTCGYRFPPDDPADTLDPKS